MRPDRRYPGRLPCGPRTIITEATSSRSAVPTAMPLGIHIVHVDRDRLVVDVEPDRDEIGFQVWGEGTQMTEAGVVEKTPRD